MKNIFILSAVEFSEDAYDGYLVPTGSQLIQAFVSETAANEQADSLTLKLSKDLGLLHNYKSGSPEKWAIVARLLGMPEKTSPYNLLIRPDTSPETIRAVLDVLELKLCEVKRLDLIE